MHAFGLNPFNIIESIRHLIESIWDLGLRRDQLAVALLPARRGDCDPDVADHAPRQRAAGALNLTVIAGLDLGNPSSEEDGAGS